MDPRGLMARLRSRRLRRVARGLLKRRGGLRQAAASFGLGMRDRGGSRASARNRSGKVYGKIGPLEVRLAANKRDVRRAQRLRYSVFYEEMSAKPSMRAQMRRRDEDGFDKICDHLLVVDTEAEGEGPARWRRRASPRVVGTYRILRDDMVGSPEGFYSQGEYDIAPLVRAKSDLKFMEVGRSCVLKPYRNKRTVELLWHGLWTYVREHKIGAMMGCASFEGVDPDGHAMALSFLHHHRLAPPEWRVRAKADLYVDMNRMAADEIDMKQALKALPPLIKGYLRLGAYVGDGAVIDRQFGTTDVFIILPVAAIDPRYFEHFGAPEESGSRIAVGRNGRG